LSIKSIINIINKINKKIKKLGEADPAKSVVIICPNININVFKKALLMLLNKDEGSFLERIQKAKVNPTKTAINTIKKKRMSIAICKIINTKGPEEGKAYKRWRSMDYLHSI
jgi:hypothetical protein